MNVHAKLTRGETVALKKRIHPRKNLDRLVGTGCRDRCVCASDCWNNILDHTEGFLVCDTFDIELGCSLFRRLKDPCDVLNAVLVHWT